MSSPFRFLRCPTSGTERRERWANSSHRPGCRFRSAVWPRAKSKRSTSQRRRGPPIDRATSLYHLQHQLARGFVGAHAAVRFGNVGPVEHVVNDRLDAAIGEHGQYAPNEVGGKILLIRERTIPKGRRDDGCTLGKHPRDI